MNLKELNTWTDTELNEIFNTITKIQNQRKAEKRKQLVKKFEEAYLALREAGIVIYHDEMGIWSFDEFEFD